MTTAGELLTDLGLPRNKALEEKFPLVSDMVDGLTESDETLLYLDESQRRQLLHRVYYTVGEGTIDAAIPLVMSSEERVYLCEIHSEISTGFCSTHIIAGCERCVKFNGTKHAICGFGKKCAFEPITKGERIPQLEQAYEKQRSDLETSIHSQGIDPYPLFFC